MERTVFRPSKFQEEIRKLARDLTEKELKRGIEVVGLDEMYHTLEKYRRVTGMDALKVLRDGEKTKTIEFRMFLDITEEYPREFVLKVLGEAGLLGAFIQVAYGGYGEGVTGMCIVTEEVARVSPGVSTCYAANCLAALPLSLSATEEQKQKYLRAIAEGKEIGAFGLTEPEAGSDAFALRMTARRDGDEYVLNNEKCFITNAGQAGFYIVFAKTAPERGERGISGFIVKHGTPGFSYGKKERKMGLHCSETRSLHFADCRVSSADLLGGPEWEGCGAIIIANTLNRSRIGQAAQSIGAAQGAYEIAFQYANARKQFGKNIIEFQAVSSMLGDMRMQIEAARALVYKAAWCADHDGDKSTIAKLGAMAKYFASEVAQSVTYNAIQVLGGNGFMEDYLVAMFYRDIRVFGIYEGTNEMQREEAARIVTKIAARPESSRAYAQDLEICALEDAFYDTFRAEKNRGEMGQVMRHRFSNIGSRLEAARALIEKAEEFKNPQLTTIAQCFRAETRVYAVAELAKIYDGAYRVLDAQRASVLKTDSE